MQVYKLEQETMAICSVTQIIEYHFYINVSPPDAGPGGPGGREPSGPSGPGGPLGGPRGPVPRASTDLTSNCNRNKRRSVATFRYFSNFPIQAFVASLQPPRHHRYDSIIFK